MSDGGKGSSSRPFSVTNEEYARRWDMIFGRDLPKDGDNDIQNVLRQTDTKDFESVIDTTQRNTTK